VEYSLAAHPPILHYHSTTRDVSELKMEQLPIAMFRGTIYESREVALLPGDLLVIVSDGFLEVTNDRGEEFGWRRLEGFLRKNAMEPLPRIIEKLSEETGRFGDRSDDQTILLVKHGEGRPA